MKEIIYALIGAFVAQAAAWVMALVGEQGSARAMFRAQLNQMAARRAVEGAKDSSLRRDSHGYLQASADEHAQVGALRMC